MSTDVKMGSPTTSGGPTTSNGHAVGGDAGGDGVDMTFLDKFSRQNAALGAETTVKMTKQKVLFYGLNGVATESLKNLVLQGCGSVTLFDGGAKVEMRDLGVNFFLEEADLGKRKQGVIAPRLLELNPLCKIRTVQDNEGEAGANGKIKLTEKLVGEHTVLVICDNQMGRAELEKWDTFCRSRSASGGKDISFIYCRSQGVFGSVFVDHGENHVVNDPNGENPLVRLFQEIRLVEGKSSDDSGHVLVKFEVPEGQVKSSFPEGAYIEFSEDFPQEMRDHIETVSSTGEKVKGVWKTATKFSDPANSIRLVAEGEGDMDLLKRLCAPGGALSKMKNGNITEKRVSEKVPSKSFKTLFSSPGNPFCDMVGTDMLSFGSELQIHCAMGVQLLKNENSKEIAGLDSKDPAEASGLCKKLLEKNQSLQLADSVDPDDNIHSLYCRQSQVELQPLSAFLGGVVGQEVVKVTGKFTPIPGWLHFHSMESVPKEIPGDIPSWEECQKSRYCDLLSIYGSAFIEKLKSKNLFMVGCGALGCELLKNFALNGICCGPKGKLTVTDADRIELSNLARQFLFREHNVGQPKSVAACAMAAKMNPGLKNNIKALELFVGGSTEDQFNDEFWESLNLVVNALDNMEARFYVDQQCVR